MRLVLAVLRPLIWLFCRLAFRIRFYGVENVPAGGACILTPNHVTYADPIWITIPVKRRIHYMAWDKPFEIPVLGTLMRVFGAFPLNVDSVDTSAQREAIHCISSGRALVVFPEGGRTKDGKLGQFKTGAFWLAVTHGIPVVPVTISGAYRVWPASRLLPRPGRLTITYHPPLVAERPVEKLNRAELKARARSMARNTREVIESSLSDGTLDANEVEAKIPGGADTELLG